MIRILGPRAGSAILGLAVLVVAAIPLVSNNSYLLYVAALIVIYCTVASAVTLLADWCRELSLGHSVFFAVGAYAYALAGGDLRFNAWMGLGVAILIGMFGGLLFGLSMHRLGGAQFALATVALAVIAEQAMIQWRSVTGGFGGIPDIRALSWGAWTAPRTVHYALALIVAAVICSSLATIRKSPWGRVLVAMGDDTVALESLGISRKRALSEAMAVSGAIAAIAGWMYAPLVQYVSPDSFTLQLSIAFLIASLLGGRLPWGPLLGAVVVVGLPECFADFSDSRLLIYAAILIVVVYWLPSGMASLLGSGVRRANSVTPRVPPQGSTWKPSAGPSEITFGDVHVRFGATVALAGVSGSIRRGAITCIVGPNGAGKTTLLNVITGNVGVEIGRVLVDGIQLPRHPHTSRAYGIMRTFQTPRVFPSLTPAENVAVGLEGRHLWRSLGDLLMPTAARRRQQRIHDEAEGLLTSAHFSGNPHSGLKGLTFGDLRSIELARAVACSPRVLLLDEPTSGLDEDERRVFVGALRDIHAKGITLAVITHDIELVKTLAEDVMIIDAGVIVRAGGKDTPEMQRELAAYSGMDLGERC